MMELMVPIYTPRSSSEATVIAALLRAHHVDFLLQGEAFSSLYPGPLSTSLNVQMLLVTPEHEALARSLLRDFLDNSQ